MKTIKTVLLAALIALLPSLAHAQVKSANFTYKYDLDSTSLTFCKLLGTQANAFGDAVSGSARVKTSGSNVAIVAQTAGQLPFAALAVDDVVVFKRSTNPTVPPDLRVVATKTDGDNITVNTAIDLSTSTTGFTFDYWKLACGTTDADGWIETGGLSAKLVTFQLDQISGVAGGIDMDVECMGQEMGDEPVVVHPGAAGKCDPGTSAGGFCNFTTAGKTTGRMSVAVPRDVPCERIRVGLAVHTSDAAEPTEADKERITVTLQLERQYP